MFPALARARLELRRADWAGVWRLATTAVRTGPLRCRAGDAAPASLRELAADLFVTPSRLTTHLRAIYLTLGAESREEAVIRVGEVGLI